MKKKYVYSKEELIQIGEKCKTNIIPDGLTKNSDTAFLVRVPNNQTRPIWIPTHRNRDGYINHNKNST